VPAEVVQAYGGKPLTFGPDYIIPKPFDPRVLVWEASAVAEAAMQSGVAQRPVNLDVYRRELEVRRARLRALYGAKDAPAPRKATGKAGRAPVKKAKRPVKKAKKGAKKRS